MDPGAAANHVSREQPRATRLFEITPTVHRIALPTEFICGDVNAYLVSGPRPTLIDTGVAWERSLGCLEAALATLGLRVGELATVVLTHPHADHAGAAATLQARSGAEVLVHERALGRLADPVRSSERETPWMRQFFLRAGFEPALVERYGSVAKELGRWQEACPAARGYRAGDRIDLGAGRTLLVHETFGHTTSHGSFELEGQGLLFTGDHVLPDITPNPVLEAPEPPEAAKPKPLLAYAESLERVAALAVTTACPGHGRSFGELASRCRALREHQQRRVAQVAELLASSPGATLRELSLGLFGRVPLWEIYLTISEVSAAIEVLEHEGRLVRRLDRGAGEVERFELG